MVLHYTPCASGLHDFGLSKARIKMIIHSKPFCFPASYTQFSIHTQYARLSCGPPQKIGTSMGEWHHSDQPVPNDEDSWGREIGCISILLGVATETSHSFQERNIFKGLTFQLAVCISSHVFHWKRRIFSCFNCVIYFQHIFPWLYLSHILFSHLFSPTIKETPKTSTETDRIPRPHGPMTWRNLQRKDAARPGGTGMVMLRKWHG